MRVNLRDLNAHLSKTLKPVYWISGAENFLVSEAQKAIATCAKKHGFDIEREVIGSHFKVDRFFELTHEMSLFSAKRCIVFTLEGKLTAALTKAIETHCKNPSEDLMLIFVGPKLQSASTQKSWFKAMDKIGIHVPIWPIDHTELPRFLKEHARKFKLNLEPDAANLLANMTEGNLFSADQTLEKLSSLHPNESITRDMLKTNADDHAHFDVFDLISASLSGNLQRANRIFSNLIKTGAEPNIILWAYTKELRLLATLHYDQKQTPLNMLFKQHYIWEKRAVDLTTALKKLPYETCLTGLQKAAKIDALLKGHGVGDINAGLQDLMMHFTQTSHSSNSRHSLYDMDGLSK